MNVFIISILAICITLLFVERSLISKSVKSLEIRIQVNGTRGKSSVTKYIALALSTDRSDVMAKITGIEPSVIEAGETRVLVRSGPARVQEQFGIIRRAAATGIKSLVLECMSITPELQQLESRIFKPHIYVITNIRDDHREVMGSSTEKQAEAICSAIPRNCTVITGETEFLDLIKEKSALKGSLVKVPSMTLVADPDQLPSGVFVQNINLALEVCRETGTNPEIAQWSIMKYVNKEKYDYKKIETSLCKFWFLNAFAANDTYSTAELISNLRERLNYSGKISLLFNTRADRPVRTDLFAGWIGDRSSEIEKVVVCGNHRSRAVSRLKKAGIHVNNIVRLGKRDIKNIKNLIDGEIPTGSILAGIGNYGGIGKNILKEIN